MLAPLTPLLIDLFGEWSLKSYGHLVGYKYKDCQDEANRTGTNEGKAEVVGGTAPVHRVVCDVERKPCHLFIQKNAKVVTKKCPREAERQEAGYHQQCSQDHEGYPRVEDHWLIHCFPPGLGLHHHSHTVTAVNIEENDDKTQTVTGQMGASEEPGQSPCSMLPPRHHIPKHRIENDGDHSNTKARVLKVDAS